MLIFHSDHVAWSRVSVISLTLIAITWTSLNLTNSSKDILWALTLALFFQEAIAQASLPTNVLAAASTQHPRPGWMRHLKCSICEQTLLNDTRLGTAPWHAPWTLSLSLPVLWQGLSLHRGRYPYRCQFCGKGCLSTTNLRRHLVTYTGVRDHKCTLCSKEFSCPWTLRRHINTHKMAEWSTHQLWIALFRCSIFLVDMPCWSTSFVVHIPLAANY